jgi:hypothetical protein
MCLRSKKAQIDFNSWSSALLHTAAITRPCQSLRFRESWRILNVENLLSMSIVVTIRALFPRSCDNLFSFAIFVVWYHKREELSSAAPVS